MKRIFLSLVVLTITFHRVEAQRRPATAVKHKKQMGKHPHGIAPKQAPDTLEKS